ncbi:unnamed protein product [Ectocarpus sp. 4 AP-2014]
MANKEEGVFLTQKAKRRGGQAEDAVDADQLEEMVAGVAQTSQSTLLLKKKKEMREVDDALEFMKDEYNTRMDNCDQREAEFEQKQVDMREQVVKFEKFIQENDAKRIRAEAKAKQERRILDQQAAELRKLEKELSSAMAEASLSCDSESEKCRHSMYRQPCETKLEGRRLRLKRYEDYLKGSSSAADPERDEISDLLNRFKTLRDANFDLMKLCEEHDTSYEKGRLEMQQYRQDKQNEVLVTNSSLNEKQMELEQIRGAVKREEHKSEQEGERVMGVCRESGQVMLAISNLHARCKQTMRSRIPDMNDKQLEKMAFLERCLHCLHVVGERIEDLGEIQGVYNVGVINPVHFNSNNNNSNQDDGRGGKAGGVTKGGAGPTRSNIGSRIPPDRGRLGQQ